MCRLNFVRQTVRVTFPELKGAEYEFGVVEFAQLKKNKQPCRYQADARCFLAHLQSQFKTIKDPSAYFTTKRDQCYCWRCYTSDLSDVLDPQGPGRFIVPRGWSGFGIVVPNPKP